MWFHHLEIDAEYKEILENSKADNIAEKEIVMEGGDVGGKITGVRWTVKSLTGEWETYY